VTFGVFAQEELDYKERLYLTFALRADDNSAFGANFNYVTYPKVSASWVLGEEPFFKVPFVSSLRLRAAYGETGQQPDAFASLRTYAPVTGGNGAGAVTPVSPGNPDLAPERGKELEVGLDGTLLHEKIASTSPSMRRKTVGGLFPRNVAPSTGFRERRWSIRPGFRTAARSADPGLPDQSSGFRMGHHVHRIAHWNRS